MKRGKEIMETWDVDHQISHDFFSPQKTSEKLESHNVLCASHPPDHDLLRPSVIYKDTGDWISQISLKEIARPHFLTWKFRFWDTRRTKKKSTVTVFLHSVFFLFLWCKKRMFIFGDQLLIKLIEQKTWQTKLAKCFFWYPTKWQTTFGHPKN